MYDTPDTDDIMKGKQKLYVKLSKSLGIAAGAGVGHDEVYLICKKYYEDILAANLDVYLAPIYIDSFQESVLGEGHPVFTFLKKQAQQKGRPHFPTQNDLRLLYIGTDKLKAIMATDKEFLNSANRLPTPSPSVHLQDGSIPSTDNMFATLGELDEDGGATDTLEITVGTGQSSTVIPTLTRKHMDELGSLEDFKVAASTKPLKAPVSAKKAFAHLQLLEKWRAEKAERRELMEAKRSRNIQKIDNKRMAANPEQYSYDMLEENVKHDLDQLTELEQEMEEKYEEAEQAYMEEEKLYEQAQEELDKFNREQPDYDDEAYFSQFEEPEGFYTRARVKGKKIAKQISALSETFDARFENKYTSSYDI